MIIYQPPWIVKKMEWSIKFSWWFITKRKKSIKKIKNGAKYTNGDVLSTFRKTENIK